MSTYITVFNHTYIKGDIMKKKSMVINLKGITKKIFAGLTALSVTMTAIYFNAPTYILEKLAGTVFASNIKETQFEDLFSLNPKEVINSMMLYRVEEPRELITVPIQTQEEKEPVIPDTPAIDISKAKSSLSVESSDIIITNTPKKQFNINELLNRPLKYSKTDGYKVLIIHTHTTESYLPNDRSENQNENIVRVGEEFYNVLNKNGIKTLHIKTVHDSPYRLSYINELESIQKALKEHPSIEVIIDVHRDGLYNEKNEKLRPVTKINGEDSAQVMLVCGTDASGLPHESWESCFSFALKIQNNMNKNYPNLARPVNLRTERFNTHMTNNSVIFEIGSNGNTLEEAINGAKYAAQAVADVLSEKQ